VQVVFVNRYFDPDSSATSQLLSDLAYRLAGRGVAIRILTSRQLYEDPRAQLAARETVGGLEVQRLWTTRFGRSNLLGRAVDYATFYLSVAWALTLRTRRDDVIVAMTDPPLLSIVAAGVAWLRRATLINWLQDLYPEVATELGANVLPRVLDRQLRRLRNASLRAAQVNIVLGTHMRERLIGCGVPERQVHIIENWADERFIQPTAPEQSLLRRKLVGADETFVVGYSGNLGRVHEFDTMLGAAQTLAHEPGWLFLIVGSGAKLAGLRESVGRLGLNNFRFLPPQPREELEQSLAAADVHLACLLPNLEGLVVPSKVYGILAAGRPLVFIGAPDGEVANLAHSTRCGEVVTTGDAQGLADKLRALRADPELRAGMAQRARALFIDRYTADGACNKWAGVLGLLKASKSSGRPKQATPRSA
jgi:glycosyltransferase involved in cell wall biosynthesis